MAVVAFISYYCGSSCGGQDGEEERGQSKSKREGRQEPNPVNDTSVSCDGARSFYGRRSADLLRRSSESEHQCSMHARLCFWSYDGQWDGHEGSYRIIGDHDNKRMRVYRQHQLVGLRHVAT
jgi:hypothetical protein